MLSICVPVFNEAENLPLLVDAISKAVDPAGIEVEIILVDDGSTDESWKVIESLAAGDGRVRGLRLAFNCGETAASDAGLRAASGEFVMTMDADLQNDPADIPKFLATLDQGWDCVCGTRVAVRGHGDGWLRVVSSRTANAIRNWLSQEQISDAGCTYRAPAQALSRVASFHSDAIEDGRIHGDGDSGFAQSAVARAKQVWRVEPAVQEFSRFAGDSMDEKTDVGIQNSPGSDGTERHAGAKRCGVNFRPRLVDLAVILLFGGTLYFTHLGDTRVLTRHEVLAAEPAREMVRNGGTEWILPTIAGVPRTAKPPGMMWLIALSMMIFHRDAEWVARLPSVLGLLSIAVMMAILAARWFGRWIGFLAGLLQLTFLYAMIQTRLCEADVVLSATECGAMFCFALAVLDSPRGRSRSWWPRLCFWLCLAAAFLLKGVIGQLFVGLSIGTFAVMRRKGIERFLLFWPGIAACLALMTAWPVMALHLDPRIYKDWFGEMIGSANGTFGSDPWWYYFQWIPLTLLPWLPLVAIGLWRGPNPEGGEAELQSQRRDLWRMMYCWSIPPLVFLTVGMKMKHYHYAIPALIPLTIPAALGFVLGCAIGAAVVWKLRQFSPEMKRAAMIPLGLLAVLGALAIEMERRKKPRAVLACWFIAAWTIAVSVQTFIMPLQDDFKLQADFAKRVDQLVPAGDTVYMLGSDEEEQEAQYSYYLRFPMQRLQSAGDLFRRMSEHPGQATFAIMPQEMAKQFPTATILTPYNGTRHGQIEEDHVKLYRIVAAG